MGNQCIGRPSLVKMQADQGGKKAFNAQEYANEDKESVIHKGVLYGRMMGPDNIVKIPSWTAHPSDVIVASYPKSGNTWVSAMVYQLLRDGEPVVPVMADPQDPRAPYLEFALPHRPSGLQLLDKIEPPRTAKTHLFYEFVEKQVEKDKARIIVVMRNPKDVITSYYHHYRLLKRFDSIGDFHDFFAVYKAKLLGFGDPFEWCVNWWEKRHLENVFVVKYEDLKKYPEANIKKMALFLGNQLDDKVIADVAAATSFKNMSSNKADMSTFKKFMDESKGKFVRSGTVGDWKNHFTQAESDYVDQKCKELFDPVRLTFDYE